MRQYPVDRRTHFLPLRHPPCAIPAYHGPAPHSRARNSAAHSACATFPSAPRSPARARARSPRCRERTRDHSLRSRDSPTPAHPFDIFGTYYRKSFKIPLSIAAHAFCLPSSKSPERCASPLLTTSIPAKKIEFGLITTGL